MLRNSCSKTREHHCEATEDNIRSEITTNEVSGIAVTRNSWTDTAIPWKERGDAKELRIDLSNGSQVFIRGVLGTDRIEISLERRVS